MTGWSIYSLATGEILRTYQGPQRMLAQQYNPSVEGAVDGVFDGRAFRVRLETGQPEPYRPPQPEPDAIWDDVLLAWTPPAAVQEAAAIRTRALAQIRVLEGRQARAVREAALGHPGALERLAAIDAQIEEMRRLLA